ncbi:hypothetical protein ABW20_dc0109093 [Dactylellina cionopaga]|nr:hypothetical protein ABW20_dc0109093 [Dactylellina cionopaga]
MEMDNNLWGTPRDALLDQLSNLLTELTSHEEGLSSTFELLDHLDGTRRAIDRLSAVITDKFSNPSSIEYFSPAVTRPLSTATDASNSSSENSLDSHLTHLSSPITLLSEYDDDIHHRRRLLDEDEELLVARALLRGEDDEADDGQGDQDERLERLSLLLSSVLQEANEAIKDYDTILEEPEEEEAAQEADKSQLLERGEVTTRCSSRLSTSAPTLIGPIPESPIERDEMGLIYSMPALHSQETIRPMLQQPPTAPPTPPPCAYKDSNLLPSPDQLSVSSVTSSAETIRPACPTPRPELVLDTEFATRSASVDGEGNANISEDMMLFAPTDPKELSLDYLLGDYLNEVIMDVRRNEFVGARFWIFLISVMGMWTWMFVTDLVNQFVGNLTCACKV